MRNGADGRWVSRARAGGRERGVWEEYSTNGWARPVMKQGEAVRRGGCEWEERGGSILCLGTVLYCTVLGAPFGGGSVAGV